MKAEIRELLRSVVKLVDEDVAELRDAVATIDHKAGEAHHAYRARDERLLELTVELAALRDEVADLRQYAEQANRYGIAAREMVLNMQETLHLSDNGDHSRRV